MARIPFSSMGATPFQKLLGHNPEILKSWNAMGETFESTGRLRPELKEQVRRTLAFGNGCEYCMAKGKPSDVHVDAKESLAVAFATIVLQDHQNIDDTVFQVLREEFDDQEIAELCAYICFTTASQMFGAMMKLEP
ncbi:carboxymuconolactone decarboxylase family protein [Brevibacillus migulae]|uniref:carboxymuconolactone decarboxylase family protein n=1 Tax=Brevibacillus migulae TaxID=1644114 RepID=UPI00106DD64F|nr:carboxymuconolactone decarboxylase family protein [Brevibacillus migulae]